MTTVSMRARLSWVIALTGAAAISGLVMTGAWKHPPAGRGTSVSAANPVASAVVETWSERFDGALDPERWEPTSKGDFKERTVDVRNGRLRLRADTRETRDDTVKFLGVRSIPRISLKNPIRLSVDLDWNGQSNGCYLSGGLVLAPASSSGNPLLSSDFLRIDYIGVPPGKNGRMVVVSKKAGVERYSFTEGWPEVRREGRPIGLQHLELVIRNGGVQVLENGSVLFESQERLVAFDSAHIYLQMSSHSNYPARELFFDNLVVRPAE